MVGASPLKMRYCRTPHLEPTVFFPIFQIMASKVPQSVFVPPSLNWSEIISKRIIAHFESQFKSYKDMEPLWSG